MSAFGELLQREVTRGEFLKMIGVIVVGAFGISNLLHSLSRTSRVIGEPSRSPQTSNHGFGSRKFGE